MTTPRKDQLAQIGEQLLAEEQFSAIKAAARIARDSGSDLSYFTAYDAEQRPVYVLIYADGEAASDLIDWIQRRDQLEDWIRNAVPEAPKPG